MIDWLLSAVAIAGGIVIVIIIIITFFVLSAFTLLAAKIVKVENATFGKALAATFLGSLAGAAVSFVLGLLFSPFLVVGAILSTIGAWLIDSLVVKAIFGTSYGKGLLITLLASVLAGVVAVVLILILLGASFLSCGL
ncbi:MAG: hypothetical protein OEV52_05515 [Dehalococcoidia bacterium]|nr:hypothetical protein [Dehalococcoidia bacterium]MDH4292053.1 hypothetical protein [Dehalococcoidia bacterium]